MKKDSKKPQARLMKKDFRAETIRLLAAYDQIIPHGAERITRMVEKEQSHRLNLESCLTKSGIKQSYRAQMFGSLIGFLGIICGWAVSYFGMPYVGGIIAGSTVIGLVSAFVMSGRRKGS